MKLFITNIGFILLAVYLILIGLSTLISGFVIPAMVMGILAIVSGVLILLGK